MPLDDLAHSSNLNEAHQQDHHSLNDTRPIEKTEHSMANLETEPPPSSTDQLSTPPPPETSRQDAHTFVSLTHQALDPLAAMTRVKSPKAGAVVLFAGGCLGLDDGSQPFATFAGHDGLTS